jgi:hypothetical protein
MMLPGKTEHELLAWATHPLSNQYVGENDEQLKIDKEVEVVWFPKTKSLCIQGHPEYMHAESKFVSYCQSLVKKYILEEE